MNLKTFIALAVAGPSPCLCAQLGAGRQDHRPQASSRRRGPTSGGDGRRPAGERAQAASGATAEGSFAAMDRNSDGHHLARRGEGRDLLTNRFSELDKDNDGRISRSEFDAHAGRRGASAHDRSAEPAAAWRRWQATSEPKQWQP